MVILERMMEHPTSPDLSVREERPDDLGAVCEINRLAFGRDDEARLVDALRAEGSVIVSLVAEENGRVVGHILFSALPITTEAGTLATAALAPMAVRPDRQSRGIGSALVRRGIEVCRERGLSAIVVVGHPDYYPRFGFSPAAGRLHDPFSAGDAFMVLELVPNALAAPGIVRYAPAFGLPE
jgi:putative acetyltransferase